MNKNQKNFLLEAIVNLFSNLPKGKVLDLGCGQGHVSQKIREKMIRVVGVDQSPPKLGSVDDFRQANLEKDPIPWNGENFDVLISLDRSRLTQHHLALANFLFFAKANLR